MKKIRWIALILCLAMLLSGCQELLDQALQNAREKLQGTQAQATDGSDDGIVTFSELEYTRPDMDALQGLLNDCVQSVENGDNYLRLNRNIDKFYTALDEYSTMMNLSNIRYAQDLTDTYYKAEYDYCVSQTAFAEGLLEELFVSLAQSEYVERLEEDSFGQGFFDMYMAPEGSGEDWEYESLWDETYTALYEREAELANEYYARQEELSHLTYGSDADYAQALETFGPLLVELIQVRQEMAEYLGYNSYEQMAGEWYYNRLYTPEQTEAYIASIREHLVPIYEAANGSTLWEQVYAIESNSEMSEAYVVSVAHAMGGDIQKACTLLMERELYDIAPSPNKAAGAFEIYLTSFQVPFILQNPTGSLEDVMGFTHEFGHFVSDYAANGTYASADVCEVYSQTMEYLSLCYADSLDARTMDLLENYVMVNSLCTYVEQAVLYSFEQQAYRLTGDELTLENLCALYEDIALDFGIDTLQWDRREWTLVPHFYQYPFYVFSYVASNDASMQIYQKELETSGAGLELYSQMIYDWNDIPLADYLSGYDLLDPLSEGRVEELAELFRTELANILP